MVGKARCSKDTATDTRNKQGTCTKGRNEIMTHHVPKMCQLLCQILLRPLTYEDDYDTNFTDQKLSLRIVKDIQEWASKFE